MIVSGRNNVKEILNNYNESYGIKRAILQKNFNENDILSLLKKYNIPFSFDEKNNLDRLAKNNHQGVLLEIGEFCYTELDSIIENKDKCTIVILDHLEDPHNLGALIRSAEIAGCHGVIIPKRRATGVTEVVAKVSVGATEYVPIARVNNLNETIQELKDKGVWIVGTDGSADTLYYKQDMTGPIAIIVGSEGRGMNKLTMKNCDFLVKIPMMGKITSLNASVSGGIVLFEALKQRLEK